MLGDRNSAATPHTTPSFPTVNEGPPPRGWSMTVTPSHSDDDAEEGDSILSMLIPGGDRAFNVPYELRAIPQWVGWRRVERDGKVTKVPVNPITRGTADATDPETWTTFAVALEGALWHEYDGIGFVFTAGDPYVGIDLDDCINPEGGEIDPDAIATVERFKSFAEVSPSGTGIHIIVRGVLPPGGRKRGDRECYDRGRFFTVTGKPATNHPIAEGGAELAKWHAETFPPKEKAEAPSTHRRPLDLTDQELLAKIGASKQGEKFAELWLGDTSDYPSGSEADLALCSILSWWTNRDAAAVDRLFRSSGLMREKWGAKRGNSTYGAITVERAVSTTVGGYDPNHGAGPKATFNGAWQSTPGDTSGERRFKWMSELHARPANDKWVWHGYLSRGGITLLSALWKSGKSTLLAHLLNSFGGSATQFGGRAVVPSRVLYVTEEDPETWAERRDKLRIGDHAGMICRPFMGRPNATQWMEFIDSLGKAVDEHQFGVVVLDTISKLWPVRDENDATAVEEALIPLWKISQRGVAVLIVHHTRKSGGTEFTESRGSGGLPAFCETLITLRREDATDRHNRRRVLEAGGRYTETPTKWTVELAADGSSYTGIGDTPDTPISPGGPSGWVGFLCELLPTKAPGVTMEVINKRIAARSGGVGAAKALLIKELNRLIGLGRITRTGEGVKGSPYKFYMATDAGSTDPGQAGDSDPC